MPLCVITAAFCQGVNHYCQLLTIINYSLSIINYCQIICQGVDHYPVSQPLVCTHVNHTHSAGNASVRTPSLLAMKLRQVERAKNVTGDARLQLVAPDIAGMCMREMCVSVCVCACVCCVRVLACVFACHVLA
jgi:hypothetical protein